MESRLGIADDYKSLCDNVSAELLRVREKLVAFTSATSGEGCTTVAVKLARAMAVNGNDTLVVDGNMRDPTVHLLHGLDNDVGLSDVVNGEATLDEAIKATAERNLSIVAGGTRVKDPFLIYSSKKLSGLFEDVKKRYDVVIVDFPPIIPYADIRVIAQSIKVLVLVIQAEKENHEVVNKAKREIEEFGGAIFGAVLNRRRYYIPEYVYKMFKIK